MCLNSWKMGIILTTCCTELITFLIIQNHWNHVSIYFLSGFGEVSPHSPVAHVEHTLMKVINSSIRHVWPANVMRTSQFSVGTVFIQDLWDMMCLPACSSRFPNSLSEREDRQTDRQTHAEPVKILSAGPQRGDLGIISGAMVWFRIEPLTKSTL